MGPLASLGLTLATFAILYNISFKFNEALTTGRIAIALLVLGLLVLGRAVPLPRDARALLIFAPLPYVLVLWVFSRDSGQFSRFFHLGLYAYLGATIVATLAGSMDRMLRILLAAISIQAVLLLVSFVSLDYRFWIGAVIATGNNFDVEEIYRAPGFASTGGSALSVVQSLGVMVGGLLLYRRRMAGATRASLGLILLMLLCLASCIVVGRTGLLLSILFLVLFVSLSGAWWRMSLLVCAVFVPLVLIAWPQVSGLLGTKFSLDYFLEWAFGFLLSGRDASVTEFGSLPIPPLSIETLLGTGLVSATVNGLNPSGHDSGFVQAYFSMGLVLSVLWYSIYAFVLLRVVSWLPRRVGWILALAFFTIELKEPFLFKYSVMFVLMAMYTLRPVAGRSSPSPGGV